MRCSTGWGALFAHPPPSPSHNAERPDVAYNLLAVDFLSPAAINTSLSRLGGQMSAGVLTALPQATHRLAAIQAALRQMSQARHVGKIVVRASTSPVARAARAGTILVIGGLGTLGSLTAAWLAQSSEVQVHATGRAGRFPADVSTIGSSLPALVASSFAGMLRMTSADAAASEDTKLLLAGSNVLGHAPRAAVVGIVHAGGVLADAMLSNQSVKGFRATWAPKVAALSRLSLGYTSHPGAMQLLFSSIAALLGSPGQANYSAANAALDVMAQASQAQVLHS